VRNAERVYCSPGGATRHRLRVWDTYLATCHTMSYPDETAVRYSRPPPTPATPWAGVSGRGPVACAASALPR